MSTTIFLHIGPRKTGTTYLQGLMMANRDHLRQQGIIIPGRRQGDHFAAGSDVLGYHGAKPHPLGTGAWADLIRQIDEQEGSAGIITDERLAWATAEQVAIMADSLDGRDVHVIYGLREIGGLLTSLWQQHVKRNQVASLGEWVEELAAGRHPWFERAHDPVNVLSRWQFPPERTHLLVIPHRSAGPDQLWRHLASIVGAPSELPNEPRRANETLDSEQITLLRRVHDELGRPPLRDGLGDVPPPSLYGTVMRDVVSDGLLARRTGASRFALPESTRPFIEKLTTATQDFLATCDHDVVGAVSDLDVAEHRFEGEASELDDAAMLDHGVRTIAGLVRRTIGEQDRFAEQLAALPRSAGPPPQRPPAADQPRPGRFQFVERQMSRAVSKTQRTTRRARHRTRIALAERLGRTYYLHIGAAKTGSTYLQQLIWLNREALMRDGVYVPGQLQRDHFSAGSDLRREPNPTQPPDGNWKGGWERLIRDAEQSGYRKILISNELLAPLTPKQVRRIVTRLSGDEVHIIYAARDLPGLVTSLWQQQAQSFRVAAWDVWLQKMVDGRVRWANRAHDVERVLERWRAGGIEHVHVITSPRPESPDTELWRRLQSVVGWSSPTRTDLPRANPSLGYSNAELLHRVQLAINRRLPEHRRTVLTKDYLSNQVLMGLPQTDAVLVPERFRPWFEAETDRRLAAITDPRNHVVGDLGDLAVNDSKFVAALPEPDEAVMLDGAAKMIAALVNNLVDERSNHRKRLRAFS